MTTRKKPYVPYPDGTGGGSRYLPDDDQIAQPQEEEAPYNPFTPPQQKYGGSNEGLGGIASFLKESSRTDDTGDTSTTSEGVTREEKPYLGSFTPVSRAPVAATGTNNDAPAEYDADSPAPWWPEAKGSAPFSTTPEGKPYDAAYEDYLRRESAPTKDDVHRHGDKSRDNRSPYLDQIKTLDKAIDEKHRGLSGLLGLAVSGLAPAYYHGEVQQLAQLRAEREAARRSAVYEGRPEEVAHFGWGTDPSNPNRRIQYKYLRGGGVERAKDPVTGQDVFEAEGAAKRAGGPDHYVRPDGALMVRDETAPGRYIPATEKGKASPLDTDNPVAPAPADLISKVFQQHPAGETKAPPVRTAGGRIYEKSPDGKWVPQTPEKPAKAEKPMSPKDWEATVSNAVKADADWNRARDAGNTADMNAARDRVESGLRQKYPNAPGKAPAPKDTRRVVQNFKIGDRVIPHVLSKDGKSWVPMVGGSQ